MGDGKVFVLRAAGAGMMELEAAGVAVKKSKQKAVKDFASRMVKDYGLADKELTQIASDKGLQFPQTLSKEMSGHIAELNRLTDRVFDFQYLQMMIGDHKKAIQLYTDGSRLSDTQLKAFAVKMLPVIWQHYQSAVEIGKV